MHASAPVDCGVTRWRWQVQGRGFPPGRSGLLGPVGRSMCRLPGSGCRGAFPLFSVIRQQSVSQFQQFRWAVGRPALDWEQPGRRAGTAGPDPRQSPYPTTGACQPHAGPEIHLQECKCIVAEDMGPGHAGQGPLWAMEGLMAVILRCGMIGSVL